MSSLLVEAEPDGGVALEATAEGDLEDTVALLRLLDLAYVIHLIPDGRGRGVAVIVEGVLAWFGMLGLELKVFGNAIDNSATTCMNAPVINATFEVGNIGGELLGDPT